jgi:hypothetical protein
MFSALSTVPHRIVLSIAVAAVVWIPATAQELPDPLGSDNDFSASDVVAAQQLGQTLGVAEWLGPLAPVALSPFFGITCLAGMSLYGQGWISADNAFLGEGSPLHNPAVFWIFLGLTLLTSIPRFSKVSKPFAQAVDHAEAWSGIITMVVLRFMLAAVAPDAEQAEVVQMGVLSTPADTLLMIAAAVNIFVINAVKFFFEMLIWITPIPTIDAIFEVGNKMTCGVLMAIYGYSPTIATGINMVMFVVAAILFRWMYRREVFFRSMLLDALSAFVLPSKMVRKPELNVFPVQAIDCIPARARCVLHRHDSGWTLTQRRMMRQDVTVEFVTAEHSASVTSGWLTNRLDLVGSLSGQLTFSRRLNHCLPELAESMGADLAAYEETAIRDHSGLKAEMA